MLEEIRYAIIITIHLGTVSRTFIYSGCNSEDDIAFADNDADFNWDLCVSALLFSVEILLHSPDETRRSSDTHSTLYFDLSHTNDVQCCITDKHKLHQQI